MARWYVNSDSNRPDNNIHISLIQFHLKMNFELNLHTLNRFWIQIDREM
jgi:hypothetical protein